MIVGLNHIAIAVPDFEEAIERFLLDFGLNFKGTEDVVSAKTKTAFFPIEGTQIELIHPLNSESPVQKFLDKLQMAHLSKQQDIEVLQAKANMMEVVQVQVQPEDKQME